MALAEFVDGRPWCAASSSPRASAFLGPATASLAAAAPGTVVHHRLGEQPVTVVGLGYGHQAAGALLVIGGQDRDADADAGLGALAAAAGPKLGRFQSAARAEAILAHASEAFTVCRTDGTIVYQSPPAARILGAASEEVLGRNLLDLLPEEQATCALQALRLPSGAPSTTFAGAWRSEDGATRHVETTAVNLVDEPAVGGILLTTRDVTERRALHIDLLQAQRLEAVGRLAAGIAHEVNTPIQFIGDNLHFLADAFRTLMAATDPGQRVPAAEDDELAYVRHEVPLALAQSIEGVERVADIVRAVKALGHPDGGAFRQVDLNRVLVDACTVATNAIKHVAVVDYDLEDVPTVRCMAGDVGQVFLNLLVNTADAVGESTSGTGTLGRITVRSRRDGDRVVVTVADTGAGIAPLVADRVFEPFFTTKEVGLGTGQGLALARAVVDRHGGSIDFESSPGHGTTFTVVLPIVGPMERAGVR